MPVDIIRTLVAEELRQGTPRWWLRYLEKGLAGRQLTLKRHDDYYSGRHKLRYSSQQFRQVFGDWFVDDFADNWCELVVDAVEERLNVEGFRLGEEPQGDKDAWRMWQANDLDAESQLAHTEALVHGYAYAIAWAGRDEQTPSLTVEHPGEVIVAHESGNRRRRLAALKKWRDEYDGREHATLYLPDAIYKFSTVGSSSSGDSGLIIVSSSSGTTSRWAPRETTSEPWPLPNPLGVVPVVALPNRRRMLVGGDSEIRPVIPIQEAVNKFVADLLVAGEFAAFRQRYAIGLEIPDDKKLEAAVNRFWTFKPARNRQGEALDGISVGEFDATDLRNFVVAIDMLVQHIASRTRTPPHYFYLRGEFPSGESIKSAETGLVAKTRRKMRHFGEGWEELIRLGFMVVDGDDRRGGLESIETIWADPESRTESEHVDAVGKKRKLLDVPRRQSWEDAGYSPQQIERMEADRERERLQDDAFVRAFNADVAPQPRPVEQE